MPPSGPIPPGGDGSPGAPTPEEPPLAPLRLHNLVLADAGGGRTVTIEAMIFNDNGIGVVRLAGERPRILPWSSVVAHAVELWRGGAIPEWWVDPELNQEDPPFGLLATITNPGATSRARPHTESGALIVVQTAHGVYRFIQPGGNPRELSGRVTEYVVRHQGPQAASSVTRVVSWGHDLERRKTPRPPARPDRWTLMKPYLAAALVVFIALAVTLILLQSAGAIHLPILGGSSAGTLVGIAPTP